VETPQEERGQPLLRAVEVEVPVTLELRGQTPLLEELEELVGREAVAVLAYLTPHQLLELALEETVEVRM
jgi:hypothetical protein